MASSIATRKTVARLTELVTSSEKKEEKAENSETK
jgi:hypothetical protein